MGLTGHFSDGVSIDFLVNLSIISELPRFSSESEQILTRNLIANKSKYK